MCVCSSGRVALRVELLQDFRLDRAPALRFGVRDFRVKHHHGISRDEAIREASLEFHRDRFAAHKSRVQDGVAHLGVVLEGHLSDGHRIRPSRAREVREQGLPVAVMIQQVVQRDAILEGGIHALPVEGDDGVCGITE